MLRMMLLPLLAFSCPLVWIGAAAPGFLPAPFQDGFQDVANIFREFNDLMEKTQGGTDQDLDGFENPLDFDQLPPNYHNEEEEEHQVGNNTVYSHHKIDKVTDNKTGEMVLSQKSVASIKQGFQSDAEPQKGCRNANDCEKGQYCQASIFTSECRECKAKDMVCRKDAECCLGYLCVWGRCAEGVTRGESGTSCDPGRGECAAGLCCTHQKSLPFPVCAQPPAEGQECTSPYGSLLRLITWGAQAGSKAGYCPCAHGLVCTNMGFNSFSSCEKPDGKPGFVDIVNAPFLQPIVRRDEELTDYDTIPLPWQLQDGRLAVVDLPRAAEDSEDEARDDIKRLSEDLVNGLGAESLPLDGTIEDIVGPSPMEFQELKKLANDMGQYYGPGFY